jgi:predicted nicotinamide N-methyase
MASPPRTIADFERFIRERTAPTPVPLAPELALYTATEMTSLWHATAAELEGWDPSPYWAFPWAGGQALARHLLDHPVLVRGRRVFDFASGSGLVAIAAGRAGAAHAVAADLDPFCEAAVRLNAALNGVAVEFRAGDAIGESLDDFDVLVAGGGC